MSELAPPMVHYVGSTEKVYPAVATLENNDPTAPAVHFVVANNGDLHLAIANEIWEELKAAAMSEEHTVTDAGFVMVSLKAVQRFTISSIGGTAQSDQHPCHPRKPK